MTQNTQQYQKRQRWPYKQFLRFELRLCKEWNVAQLNPWKFWYCRSQDHKYMNSQDLQQ